MTVGAFTFYDSALLALTRGRLDDLSARPVAATLLGPGYIPSPVSHSQWSDVAGEERTDADYSQQALSNAVFTLSDGIVTFTSDPVVFGTNVTLLNVRYLVLVAGSPDGLLTTDLLIGFQDLSQGGGTVESRAALFQITPPAGGWFTLAQGGAL